MLCVAQTPTMATIYAQIGKDTYQPYFTAMAFKLEINTMLEKIEVTYENIGRIANPLFKDRTGGNLEDINPYIKRDWYREAEILLADYNRVVELMNVD